MKRQVALTMGMVALFFTTSVLASQQPDDANNLLTLQDYLHYASLNNVGLKAAYEQWQGALEQITQAKSLPDPQVSYGYATEPTPMREMFETMQMFPWFGTIKARTDGVSAAAKAAFKQYEAKKLEVFYDVKQGFYEFVYLAKAINITNENLDLLKRFEEVARIRYTTLTTTHPDIIRAQIELAILENSLQTLRALRPAIVARLNSILNRPSTSDLPWPQHLAYEQASIDHQQVVTIMAENNPQLQALSYEIQSAKSNEELAEKRFYPDFGVGFGVDSGMGNDGEDRIMAKFSFTLPIWRDNYKAARRQAKAQLNQKTHEKNQMENTLAADVQQLLFEFEDSGRKIKLYRDMIIPKAKEMLTASESAYQAGTIDFLSLIDAQRLLLNYQLDYERYLAENAQKLANIEMLTATELPTIESKPQPEQK